MLMSTEYAPYLIKEYRHWSLFLHRKQMPYLGRCYAWWKDTAHGEGEGLRPSDLSPEALVEVMRTVFEDVVDACHALGHSTDEYGARFRLNMAYFANEREHRHHLHWHFVPRFGEPLRFEPLGRLFCDTEFHANYAKPPGGERVLPEDQLQTVRAMMAKAIGGAPAASSQP